MTVENVKIAEIADQNSFVLAALAAGIMTIEEAQAHLFPADAPTVVVEVYSDEEMKAFREAAASTPIDMTDEDALLRWYEDSPSGSVLDDYARGNVRTIRVEG